MSSLFSSTEARLPNGGLRGEYAVASSCELTGYPTKTVFLNVYDVNQANAFLAPMGVGIFHTGVEVDGCEVRYGRGDRGSGVEENSARLCPPHNFREQYVLGVSPLSKPQINQVLSSLMADAMWDANKYHLVKHNCVHFAEYVANLLLPASHRAAGNLSGAGKPTDSPDTNATPVLYSPTDLGFLGTPASSVATAASLPSGGVSATLPPLFPPHVGRLSRIAQYLLPDSFLNRIDSWDAPTTSSDSPAAAG